MDVVEDCKIFRHPLDIIRLTVNKRAILTKITDMDAEYVAVKEPIPFERRADGIKPIRNGGKWGGMTGLGLRRKFPKKPAICPLLPLLT